jgi:hypothetical protein
MIGSSTGHWRRAKVRISLKTDVCREVSEDYFFFYGLETSQKYVAVE